MAALKALDRWLDGSGWKEALMKAKVASEGVAESFISASHLARTRRAHQITAGSLYALMTKLMTSTQTNKPLIPSHLWNGEMR